MTSAKPHFVLTCGRMPKKPDGAGHFVVMHRNGHIRVPFRVDDMGLFLWSRLYDSSDIIAVKFEP